MKKAFILIISLLVLFVLSSCSSETPKDLSLHIADGIQLGMSLKEVVAAAEKTGKSIVDKVIETTIAEQPYTNVYFSFVDSLDEFDSSIDSNDAIVHLMMNGLNYSYSMSGISQTTLKATDENAKSILVQACAYFTSDKKLSTATETFDKIEKYLDAQYGETRYTSRRGEALPLIAGYKNADYTVVTKETNIKGKTYPSIPYYSQRIISTNDGKYVVIDHHIIVNESKNTFEHCIIYSLIPKNIE